MTVYIIEGVLGSVVGRTDSTEEVQRIVLGQLALSDKAQRTLRNKLAGARVGGKVDLDYGGSGVTIHVRDE